MDVPLGEIDIITSRGLEYKMSYQQININEGENVQLDIVLERWINMAIGPGDCDREFFEGKPNDLSESNHIFYYNQEYRSWIYGHLTLFSLTEWLEPNVSGMGSNQWDYPPNSDICDMVHQQGGFVSYSHPAYKVDPIYDVYEDPDVLFAATELSQSFQSKHSY